MYMTNHVLFSTALLLLKYIKYSEISIRENKKMKNIKSSLDTHKWMKKSKKYRKSKQKYQKVQKAKARKGKARGVFLMLLRNVEFADDVRLQPRRRDSRLQVPAQSRPSMALPDPYRFILSPPADNGCAEGLLCFFVCLRTPVWLACALSFILGLPSLGSSVAFSAATSIATIGLYTSYGAQFQTNHPNLPFTLNLSYLIFPQDCPSPCASSTRIDSREGPSTSAGSPTQ